MLRRKYACTLFAVRRIVTFLLVLIVGAYVALVLLGIFADRIIFQPSPSTYTREGLLTAARGLGIADARVVSVESHRYNAGRSEAKQETITAVYLPNGKARYTLLFSHGNAEDLGDDLPLLDIYRRAGFSIFAYDYRGYGLSTGRASESGVYADAEAAYEYLTGELRVPPQQVIIVGRSLGCAAALQVATTHPSAGLVLEAPFLTAFKVLTRVKLLPFDRFDNESKIRQYRGPLLVIQGESDEVIPVRHGKRIYQLASGPKRSLWVADAHHNDVLFTAAHEYLSALQEFTASLSPTDVGR